MDKSRAESLQVKFETELTGSRGLQEVQAERLGRLCEWQYDHRDAVFRFDPHSASIFGLDASQQPIALQTVAQRVPASERDVFVSAFQRWQPGQAAIRLVHRLWNAHESRWMELQTIGYPSADGALTGFSQDISRSGESEEVLRRYRTLLFTSGVFGKICYWTLDYADGAYQVSDDLVDQIGFPAGTTRIPEADFSSRIHPDDIERTIAMRRAATKDDVPAVLEYRLWKATEERWIHVRSPLFLVRDARGKPVTIYGFTQDVTEQKEAEGRLQRERQRIESAQILGRMGTWTLDLTTRVFRSNARALEMSGIPADGELEVDIEEMLSQAHPDDRDGLVRILDRAYQTLDPLECEFRRWHPTDRRWVHRKLVAQVANDADGIPYELQGFTQDITKQKETEESLRVSASVFEHSRSLILITDVEQRIIQVNPAFCELSGYAEHEVIGQTPDQLKRLKLSEGMWHGILQKLTRERYFSGEFRAEDKEGHDLLIAITISAVRDGRGEIEHFIYVGEDITQQKAAEAQINHLAYYDALTRLPNRALLRERADAALEEARQHHGETALIFLDLDHFKNVNDSLGHSAGDQLLTEIARRLQASVRSTDTVGRLGGDEFMIIMPRAGLEPARRVAEQLIDTLSQPIVVEGISLTTTSSIGIAIYPLHGENYANLMRAADAAMYKAKEEGRGTIAEFAPSINEKALKHLVLTNELRQAVHERQLQLYYQPQVSLKDGRLIGAEALLRWPHPTRGLIPPAEFIPTAEESGIIEPLGAWVIGEACRQAVAWSEQGLPALGISINCSARQFLAPLALLDTVRRALAETGLPAERLELEITESMIVQDVNRMHWVLEQFRDLGVGIAIDDFGTGYSSLSYLKRLPIDKLKIDRSFVRDIETDPDDLTIAATVATLGRSLGLRVVAEGVETREQLLILKAMRCDEGQGYFWAKPMPVDEFVAWAHTHYADTKAVT